MVKSTLEQEIVIQRGKANKMSQHLDQVMRKGEEIKADKEQMERKEYLMEEATKEMKQQHKNISELNAQLNRIIQDEGVITAEVIRDMIVKPKDPYYEKYLFYDTKERAIAEQLLVLHGNE